MQESKKNAALGAGHMFGNLPGVETVVKKEGSHYLAVGKAHGNRRAP